VKEPRSGPCRRDPANRESEGVDLPEGSNGRWDGVFTEEELAAFRRRSDELLPADAMGLDNLG
jgi:hypothetical protein